MSTYLTKNYASVYIDERFLDLGIVASQWLGSSSSSFTFTEIIPDTFSRECWVSPKAGLEYKANIFDQLVTNNFRIMIRT
jgi:hypothetical protein